MSASLGPLLLEEFLESSAIILGRSAEWREEIVTGLGSVLRLPEIGVELKMAALYR